MEPNRNFGLGWNPDNESRHDDAMKALWQPVCAVADSEIADAIDYGNAIPVKNQLHFNSCDGNATATALQGDEFLTYGKSVELSARASYIFARLMDGTNDGPDAGASIQGGAIGAKEYGAVSERDFPYYQYGDRFDPSMPADILQLAGNHRIRSACPLRNYDEWLRFVGTRQGTTIIGIWWTDALANYRGEGPVINDRGRRVGGHALAAFEYIDVNGVKYPVVRNSHAPDWGRKGRMWVAPDIFDRWLTYAPFGAMGVSGLPRFSKRSKPEMIQEAFA